MNSKNFAIATVIGAILSTITGFLIFGMALHSYMDANTMEGVGKAEPDMLWIVISHLFLAATLTYIFMKWAAIKTLNTGLMAGLVIGLLVSLTFDTIIFATSNMFSEIVPLIVDVIGGTIIWAVAGAGVGWSLGKFE